MKQPRDLGSVEVLPLLGLEKLKREKERQTDRQKERKGGRQGGREEGRKEGKKQRKERKGGRGRGRARPEGPERMGSKERAQWSRAMKQTQSLQRSHQKQNERETSRLLLSPSLLSVSPIVTPSQKPVGKENWNVSGDPRKGRAWF